MIRSLHSFIVFVVTLAVGVFIGSFIAQWTGAEIPGLPVLGGGERGARLGRVRVEVLNSGGVQGMALRATALLRDDGFDVVFFGNAPTFDADSSVVLDRVGRIENARAVADALGIRNVRSELDANLYLDVTVRLGRDWVPAEEGEEPAEPTVELPWWSPRRWPSLRDVLSGS
ncbi:MAG: LytR C-terminal domain-containing protein [Gemmatimonadota bacterium]|nr:LytR C-terminal domain-containing protein [Gemmatimonadota bacterium]MDH5760012.1 LytR C-terminal domain-containing protein [Gemmatimonadota bacterium]